MAADRVKVFELNFRGIPEDPCNLTCPIDPRELPNNAGGLALHRSAERYYREHGPL